MTALLLAPLALAVAGLVVAASSSRSLRPRTTAWLLAGAIVLVFSSVVASAWVLSLGLLSGLPGIHQLLTWCLHPVSHASPAARWAGGGALLVAVLSTGHLARVAVAWRRQRTDPTARVRVVVDARALAYVEAGPGGSVVVSTGMLAALRPLERRAMLAHEVAHVRHRHDRFLAIGRLAAPLPLLAGVQRRLHLALERWADEVAAVTVGDRTVVAHAVARASLTAHEMPAGSLGMAGGDVVARVDALLEAPTGRAPLAAGALGAFGVTLAAAAVQVHHLPALLHAIC